MNQNKEFQRALLTLTYGLICDAYQMNNERMQEVSNKSEVSIWIDGTELVVLLVQKKQIYRIDLTRLANIQDQVSVRYRGQLLKNNIQLTIFHQSQLEYDQIVFTFESKEIKDLCYNGLLNLIIQDLDQCQFLRYQVKLLIQEHNIQIFTVFDVKFILEQLKIFLNPKYIKQVFFLDKQKNPVSQISQKDFLDRVPTILARDELRPVFMKYALFQGESKEPVLTAYQFRKFLLEQQKQKLRIEDVINIIAIFDPHSTKDQNQSKLTFDQFVNYIFSLNCHAYSLMKTTQYQVFHCFSILFFQDMNGSLDNYFINSSRNSLKFYNFDPFLPSSDFTMLANLFEKGIRHIELDIWENENMLPVCITGVFQNQQVPLEEVLEFLKYNAFKKSSFPLFISIDNHCPSSISKLITRSFNDVLGDQIHRLVEGNLPSPNQIKEKFIIIGAAKLKLEKQSLSPIYRNIEEENKIQSFMKANAIRPSVLTDGHKKSTIEQIPNLFPNPILKTLESVENEYSQLIDDMPQRIKNYVISATKKSIPTLWSPKEHKIKLNIKQKNLQICKIKEEANFRDVFEIEELYKIYSFLEVVPEQMALLKEKLPYLILTLDGLNYNRVSSGYDPVYSDKSCSSSSDSDLDDEIILCNMTKFYPTFQPLDSSNSMVPHGFKRRFSFPLVDYNSLDLNYMYNYAKFTENGGCGYLLKQPDRTSSITKADMRDSNSSPMNHFKDMDRFLLGKDNVIKIEIVSGYQLQGQFNANAEPLDPRIQVQLIDPNYDENIDVTQIQQTDQVPMNSYHPIYNQKMEFHYARKETAVLIVQVFNKFLDLAVSWNAIPLCIIKEGRAGSNNKLLGYRVIPLKDKYLNDLYNSYILCLIEMN